MGCCIVFYVSKDDTEIVIMQNNVSLIGLLKALQMVLDNSAEDADWG